MFIKTKKVKLKKGIQEYYYLAKSIRINGQPVPKIIKYLGKTIPEEYLKLKRYTTKQYFLKTVINTV